MKPTEVLIAEHKNILNAVSALGGVAKRLRTGEDIPADFFIQAVAFIREYADARHHGKEEVFLFPALEAKGIPNEGGPIGVMLTEHGIGRSTVAEMETAARKYSDGDATAREQLATACEEYARLLYAHIDKEDNVLFRMADEFLDDSDHSDLMTKFEEVDARREFADKREAYEQWAVDAATKYGVPVEA